jgi:molybdopterin molybdotransferase
VDDRLGVDEALQVIWENVAALPAEKIATRRALTRRLAEPACARIDVPRFRASAMDGFAVASKDCSGAAATAPVDLAIGDPVQAGSGHSVRRAGSAIPISTGAPMPLGADAVVIRERAVRNGDLLRLVAPVLPFTNVRAIGEDALAGKEVLPVGALLTADSVGALVGYGVNEVVVYRRPRLLLFSTGNELVTSITSNIASETAIVDSNTPMIEAFAAGLGLEIASLGGAKDVAVSVDSLLKRATSSPRADLVISTGGVSGGAFDLVRARLEALGGRVHFHGVRMRPGKPLLFASLPDGRPYFGLPGNPVAALVGMRFFVLAAIRAMAGLPPEAGEPVTGVQTGRVGTTEFLRGKAIRRAGAVVRVDTNLDQRSHVLSSVLVADTWLRVDRDGAGHASHLAFAKVPPPV